MKLRIRHIALCATLLIMGVGVGYAKEPRISTQLYADSTYFTMKVMKGSKIAAGKSFKVKIHVAVHPSWHVWSSTMSDDGGLLPLTVKVPDSLAKYFEISRLKEISTPKMGYDSNFMVLLKANHEPFDLIATIAVKRNPPAHIPLRLLVKYQAVSSTYCMPPCTYEVPMTFLGQPPIKLRATNVVKSEPFELASLYQPE